MIAAEWVALPTPAEQLTLAAAGMRICPVCGITRTSEAFAGTNPADRPLCRDCRTPEGRATWADLVRSLAPLGQKYCGGACHSPRPVAEFYTNPARPDGLSPYCKECRARMRAEDRRRRTVAFKASGLSRYAYVYRLYDARGRLLYIGKTFNVGIRLLWGPCAHAGTKEWWPEVAYANVSVYLSDADALAAEAHAIRRERPSMNIHRPRLHALGSEPKAVFSYFSEIA